MIPQAARLPRCERGLDQANSCSALGRLSSASGQFQSVTAREENQPANFDTLARLRLGRHCGEVK